MDYNILGKPDRTSTFLIKMLSSPNLTDGEDIPFRSYKLSFWGRSKLREYIMLVMTVLLSVRNAFGYGSNLKIHVC